MIFIYNTGSIKIKVIITMNDREYEDSADRNWDYPEELSWTEFDWQRYLKDSGREVSHFLELYHQLKDNRENFDQISTMMGWDAADWVLDEEDGVFLSSKLWSEAQSEDINHHSPYTVHKHPVFIVTRGLYSYLNHCLEYLASNSENQASGRAILKFTVGFNEGQHNAIMAVNTLDVGDFNLSICHIKIALEAMNQSLYLLNRYAEENKAMCEFVQKRMVPVCFDLREMWLRVMTECREEVRHQGLDME